MSEILDPFLGDTVAPLACPVCGAEVSRETALPCGRCVEHCEHDHGGAGYLGEGRIVCEVCAHGLNPLVHTIARVAASFKLEGTHCQQCARVYRHARGWGREVSPAEMARNLAELQRDLARGHKAGVEIGEVEIHVKPPRRPKL